MAEELKNPVMEKPGPWPEHDEDAVAFSAAHMHGEEQDEAEPIEAQEDPFLRAPRRVPIRKGPVTKRTADRMRIAVIAALVVGVLSASAYGVWSYATRSWRFRIESGDSIESSGLR